MDYPDLMVFLLYDDDGDGDDELVCVTSLNA